MVNNKPLDDLTIIKGIGPVWQRRMRRILGVRTYQDLAELSCEKILSQLKAEGTSLPTMSDCESWINQAREIAAEAEDSSDAEAKNNDPEKQTVSLDGTEKWQPFATFVVEFLMRAHARNHEERQTKVQRMEDGGTNATWPDIDIMELSKWIAEQLGESPVSELEQQLEDERARMQYELEQELVNRKEAANRDLQMKLEEERNNTLETIRQELKEEKAKARRKMEAEIQQEHTEAHQALEQKLEGKETKAQQELERKLEEEKIQAQHALQKQLEEERTQALNELEEELNRNRTKALLELEQELDEMKTRVEQELEEERVQTPEEEKIPQQKPKKEPAKEARPPETAALSEIQLKPIITQIRAFQPLDAKEPIGRGEAGQPFSGFVSSIEPFTFDVDFELAEPAVSELEQFGKNYHVEFYIRNISTGEKKHLGNTKADTFIEGKSSYAAQLTAVTLTPGVYNLLVFLLVQNGRPSADFWEIPFLQVT